MIVKNREGAPPAPTLNPPLVLYFLPQMFLLLRKKSYFITVNIVGVMSFIKIPNNVPNRDFFQLIISTLQHQFYLNNVIRIHLQFFSLRKAINSIMNNIHITNL